MPVHGLHLSHIQEDNGMTEPDMRACKRVADKLNEVIIFRSTGPWSQRWIMRDYPTKNFHVKGKSSDWGPQAGFVPTLGLYSKVGGDADKELAGDKANRDGMEHKYAAKTQLCLTLEELEIQRDAVSAGRRALTVMQKIEGSEDYLLVAERPGDHKRFTFRAVFDRSAAGNRYKIFVFGMVTGMKPLRTLMFEAAGAVAPEWSASAPAEGAWPLEVMTSSEVGANNRPLTGDYDLMAVCPSWGNYGSRSVGVISKPGVNFGRKGGAEVGQTFNPGSNLDGALDMRTNTGMVGKQVSVIGKDGKPKQEWRTFGKEGFGAGGYNKRVESTPGMTHEHGDMGNLTPRILRCVNELNLAMGQTGPFRRVHHNAESHRNVIFGGITGVDMGKGEAFPLTVFQPAGLNVPGYPESVFTLLNLGEFKAYATLLNGAGFFVPRSWVWGMSIRDQHA
ncbi:MAG: hypothetical protein JWO86_4678 [Myxococcaceae bacterium]|nr:hypothetical protein [Myxococcaceae bacterium]